MQLSCMCMSMSYFYHSVLLLHALALCNLTVLWFPWFIILSIQSSSCRNSSLAVVHFYILFSTVTYCSGNESVTFVYISKELSS